MTARLIRYFALFLCLFSVCGVAYAAGETFTIVSVTYTDAAGKQQTVAFNAKMGDATIPAIAVGNDVIINGNYTPANATVSCTIDIVRTPGATTASSGTPTTDGKGGWTYTIAKNKLVKNAEYLVFSSVGITPDTAKVDGVNVKVVGKTLFTSP
jgi:hypothetical protein